MKNIGVLILSHCGFSFVDQLAKAVQGRGYKALVLSSKPESADRPKVLEQLADWVQVTNNHTLSWRHVEQALSALEADGIRVHSCICVWEGYRTFMANVNLLAGTPDITPEQIDLLTDKYSLRQFLVAQNISRVDVKCLTPELLGELKRTQQLCFIKPRRGIASFGAFKLNSDTHWHQLQNIVEEARHDPVYGSYFKAGVAFVVEDFIAGIECSFEVQVVDGHVFVVAVHEKYETTHCDSTTLENACTCPPVSMEEAVVKEGVSWLHRVLGALDITQGCFHIEAKVEKGRWEIIEINPRVGGSLISQSVEYFTDGRSMVDLWVESLLVQGRKRQNFMEDLADLDVSRHGNSPHNRETFFRVFYGEVGVVKTVEEIPVPLPPLVTQVFVTPGTEFECNSKENFIGQALWGGAVNELLSDVIALDEQAKNLLKVEYQPIVTKSVA
jgi:ATP-grasp domain.